MNLFYVIAAAISYGCILTVLVFDIVFGLRALFHVKRELVMSLPEGFSPLDYQRIIKGKTRPDQLTRALLVWWAQKGYIRIEGLTRNTVRVWKLKEMPPHNEATFYDRGTYVRERKIFCEVFFGVALESGFKDIHVTAPLLRRKTAEEINKSFAIGENEGVFGAGHFILKIITQILCFVPYFLAVAWASYSTDDSGLYIGFSIFSVIGVLALKYVLDIPRVIRIPFFSIWGGLPYVGIVLQYLSTVNDPWCFGLAALLFYALGTFFFILFADYREKENLEEYSLLFNYRKFLFTVRKKAVAKEDYYKILPFLYTINLGFLLKPKFRSEQLPDWYSGEERSLL